MFNETKQKIKLKFTKQHFRKKKVFVTNSSTFGFLNIPKWIGKQVYILEAQYREKRINEDFFYWMLHQQNIGCLFYYLNNLMLKAVISLVLFTEVLFFTQLPYRFPKISTSQVVMEIFQGFSTGLFLGIAFFHMIPEANHKLQGLFSNAASHQHQHHHDHAHEQQQHSHSHDVPLGALISLFSFLCILTLQTYFHDEEGQHMHGHAHAHHHTNHHIHHHKQDQAYHSTGEKKQEQKKYFESPKKLTYKPYEANNDAKNSPKKPKRKKRKIEVILTQVALSLHCFFQCLSIGIQQNHNFVLTLAFAICFHKWAQALTLGYSYYEAGMTQRSAMKYSLFHALLNSSAVLIGWAISSTSDTMAGIFNGVAGGTFLYVSFIQKIAKEFTDKKTILKKISLTMIGLVFSMMIG